MTSSRRLAARAQHLAASELRELLKLIGQPDLISFAGGVPDPTLFPRQALRDSYDRALADSARSSVALQYTTTEGHPKLREWIANYLRADGIACDAENILITNGSQQGIDFAAKLFLDPGDCVLVQRPTFLGALQAFRSYECSFDSLPTTTMPRPAHSYRVANTAPKIMYAMADFQNPTGESLSLAERQQLVELARELDVVLLEDLAYRHLRYDGDQLPSLTCLELAGRHIDDGRAIYLGTFSKSIAPGLRIGWLAAPANLIQQFVFLKQASDVQVSTLNQIVMSDVVATCFDSLVVALRNEYRSRRDCMLQALSRYFPAEATWTKAEGGFFLWVTLPEEIDAAALLRRSLREAQVAFVPGRPFFADGRTRNTLRLSYSFVGHEKIEIGLQRLGQLLKAMIASPS
jgi:DNA-binding transcriptional MocR family regulator